MKEPHPSEQDLAQHYKDKYSLQLCPKTQSGHSSNPLYAPPIGGLPPLLYHYILGELGIPQGSRRGKVSNDTLYDLLFSLSYSREQLQKLTLYPLMFKIDNFVVNHKAIDGRHEAIFDLVAEDGIDAALPFIRYLTKDLKAISAKVKSIDTYRDGRLRVSKVVPNGTVKSTTLVEFIIAYWQVDDKTALTLISALGGLTNRVTGINARYGVLTSNVKNIHRVFKPLFTIVGPIYYLADDESEIGSKMVGYLDYIDGKTLDTGIKFYRKKSLAVLKNDFASMSLRGKMIIMRNLHHYEDGILYVHMKTRQSYGNYGRQQNVLAEMSRSDRKMISNLYGFDMESALQTILYRIFQPRGYELPYTYKYIINKKSKRETMMRLTGLSMDGVKALITSVYQGLKWAGENHRFIKDIMTDAATLRQAIMDIELDDKEHKEALKYATHACKHSTKVKMTRLQYERSTSKEKRLNYEKTFMFHFWTFYERQIQDVMSRYFSNPLPLHDAVYTQDKDEFEDFDIVECEQCIYDETGIKIGLDKA